MPMDLRALTVHEPWASLIAYGVKPVENRTWASTFMLGKRLAIHRGQKVDFEGAEVLRELGYVRGEVVYREHHPTDAELIGLHAVVSEGEPSETDCYNACAYVDRVRADRQEENAMKAPARKKNR